MCRHRFLAASVLLAIGMWAIPEISLGQEFASEGIMQAEIDSLLEIQKKRMFPLYGCWARAGPKDTCGVEASP